MVFKFALDRNRHKKSLLKLSSDQTKISFERQRALISSNIQTVHSGTKSGCPPDKSIIGGRLPSCRKRSSNSAALLNSECLGFADKRSKSTKQYQHRQLQTAF